MKEGQLTVLHDWDHAYPAKFLECLDYLHSLIVFNQSRNIKSIIGLHTSLYNRMPTLERDLRDKYPDLDIRIHIHLIDDVKHPLRRRIWVPPLTQGDKTWRYDSEYVRRGVLTKLKEGELPLWHVDYPEYFPAYVRWATQAQNGEIDLYE